MKMCGPETDGRAKAQLQTSDEMCGISPGHTLRHQWVSDEMCGISPGQIGPPAVTIGPLIPHIAVN
jgi:hypothetical protein